MISFKLKLTRKSIVKHRNMAKRKNSQNTNTNREQTVKSIWRGQTASATSASTSSQREGQPQRDSSSRSGPRTRGQNVQFSSSVLAELPEELHEGTTRVTNESSIQGNQEEAEMVLSEQEEANQQNQNQVEQQGEENDENTQERCLRYTTRSNTARNANSHLREEEGDKRKHGER